MMGQGEHEEIFLFIVFVVNLGFVHSRNPIEGHHGRRHIIIRIFDINFGAGGRVLRRVTQESSVFLPIFKSISFQAMFLNVGLPGGTAIDEGHANFQHIVLVAVVTPHDALDIDLKVGNVNVKHVGHSTFDFHGSTKDHHPGKIRVDEMQLEFALDRGSGAVDNHVGPRLVVIFGHFQGSAFQLGGAIVNVRFGGGGVKRVQGRQNTFGKGHGAKGHSSNHRSFHK
mmetsp:Transcript_13136/g.36343  ORF Transcript_13136/g.36343 Transcript_13136/m.36343 type:complete len:226 (-) Transcript_13136:310-987(-)